MKTKVFFLIVLLGLEFQYVFSQEAKEPRPMLNLLSFSIGFGGLTQSLFDGFYYTDSKPIPLVRFSYERNVANVFNNCYLGVGGEVSYRSMSPADGSSFSYTYIAPRISVNYVFENNPNLRIYGSCSLGKMMAKENYISFENSSKNYSINLVQFHVGGRYFIANVLGLFAELGSGMTSLNMGLNIRF